MYFGSFHFTFPKCVNEIYRMANINSYNMKQDPDAYYPAQKPMDCFNNSIHELFPKVLNQIAFV